MIKLDLKKFKHVKSDDKTCTLRHSDGHELTVAIKALSKPMQEQLNALKAHTKESAQEPKQDTKMYAEGGMATNEDNIKDVLDFNPMSDVVPEAPAPIDTLEAKMAEYRAAFPNQPQEVIERSAIRDMRGDRQALEAGAQDREKAAADAQYKKEYDQEMAAEKVSARNKNLASAGLPVQETMPSGPQAGALVQATPSQSALAPQDTMPQDNTQSAAGIMQGGVANELAGINLEAKAKGDLALKQEKLYNDQIVASQEIKRDFDSKFSALEKERQDFMQDIKNGQINPDKYWDNHSKIAAGIGMILAGFSTSSAPNAAADFIEKQMELNLQAQQKNLDSKNNLLSANLQQFKNLEDATNMTRVMQADMVNNQLLSAAAKAANPLAKAAALKAAGEIQAKYAPLVQKISEKQTLAAIQDAATKDPKKIPAMLAAVRQLSPERAKELEEKHIPGIGFASTNEGAKGIREMGTTVKTVNESIQRLKEIQNKTGKSLNLNARAEADTIRNMLIGQLRVPITGPGAMSDGEREILMNSIPDVTSMTSLDSSNRVKLDALQSKITGQYRNMLQLNGLDPSRVPGMASDQDKIKRLQELRKKAGK